MKKKIFYTEAAYIFGILILSLGTAFMERGDFGMSMVVAPAYILHLKISEFLPFFSFGMAEYTFQLLLIIGLSVFLRKLKRSCIFSFVTVLLYGFALDLFIWTTSFLPDGDGIALRLVFFLAGMLMCSTGVALLFHTYLPPEAYELVVKEISAKYNFSISKCKTAYDCISCAAGIILSFVFFGFMHFEGVKFGTVFCALFNGLLIGKISKVFEHHFEFKDGLPLRSFFTS